MKMKDVVIIGAGGFAREVAWLIEEINKKNEQWNILGFIDDNTENIGKSLNGYKIIGNTDEGFGIIFHILLVFNKISN